MRERFAVAKIGKGKKGASTTILAFQRGYVPRHQRKSTDRKLNSLGPGIKYLGMFHCLMEEWKKRTREVKTDSWMSVDLLEVKGNRVSREESSGVVLDC